MKTTKKVVVEVEETEDIICNKCGESCNVVPKDLNSSMKEFNGIIEYEVSGGYFGTAIADGDGYRFSVCEKCLVEFMKSFKIDPYVGNIMDYGLTPEEINEMVAEPDNSRFIDPFGKEDEVVELVQPFPVPKKEDLN